MDSTSSTANPNGLISGISSAISPALGAIGSGISTATGHESINGNPTSTDSSINFTPLPSTNPADVFTSTPQVKSNITSADITPAIPLALPATTQSSAQSNLSATANSYMTPPPNTTVNNGIATANPPVNPTSISTPAGTSSPTLRDTILNQLNGLNTTLGTKTQATNDLNSQYGVDQKQQNYIDAYNAYQSKKTQYDQQIEQLYNTPGGTTAGVQASVSQIQRENNADLANLSIIAQSAQGNYQGALDIVQRKINAEFDPIQTQIDNLGKFLDLNNADLTDSEKTQIENQRYILQNNVDQLKSAKLSAHQFALQQGITDPNILNAIDAAQTPTDAYAAIGGTNGQLPASANGNGAYSNIDQQYQQYIDKSSDGVPYVDQTRLQNMTPYQKQIASQQYANAGIRVLDPGDVSALGTIDAAKQDLTLFSNAANNLLSLGLFGRIKGYTTNQLAQLAQTNPDWRQFQTLRTGLIKSIQGVASGAPGLRVTGAELSNAADALPNSFDNKESAQKAITTFSNLLNTNRNILLRGSAPGATKSTAGGWSSLGD